MESQTTTEPAWGAPPSEPAHWSLHKTLAAAGIAAVLAGAGAAVIYAASGSTEQAVPGFGGPGGMGGPPGGPGGPGFGAPAGATAALHGEFVVSDGHGGYATELMQTGTVTEVSDTSITARSEDGFTLTYLITADTRQGRSAVEQGDTATIRAVAGNDTKTGTNTATVISPTE